MGKLRPIQFVRKEDAYFEQTLSASVGEGGLVTIETDNGHNERAELYFTAKEARRLAAWLLMAAEECETTSLQSPPA
jgi:hypothetical protein